MLAAIQLKKLLRFLVINLGYGGYKELRIQIVQASPGKEKLKQIGIED
jgi:hypothetical protein